MSYSRKYRTPNVPITVRNKYIDHNEEYDIPADHQQIVLIICNKGNSLFEGKTADGCTLTVHLPQRFRKLLWIRRGTYVLVEPVDNQKLRAEIVKVYTLEHIQFLKNNNAWPEEFEAADNSYKCVNANHPKDARESNSSDESGTESGSEQEYSTNEDYASDNEEGDASI